MTDVMRSPVVPTRSEARLRLLSQRLQVLRAEIDIILAELAAEQLRADYGFDRIAASEATTSPPDAVAPSADTVRQDAPAPVAQQATVPVNDARPHEDIAPRPAADRINTGERAATEPATLAAGHANGAVTAAPASPAVTPTPMDTAASAADVGAAPIRGGDDTPSCSANPNNGNHAAAATASIPLMFGQGGISQNGIGRHLPTIEAQFDELPGFAKVKPPPIPTAMLQPVGPAGVRDAEIIDLAAAGRPARQPAADVAAARNPRLRWRLVTTIAACILILLAFIVAMLADGRLIIGADATTRLKPAIPAIEAVGERAASVPTSAEPGQAGDPGLHELSSDDTGAAIASTPR